MENNFYKEKIVEIKILINDKKFKEAYVILKEEISMPYIPKRFEFIFEELMKELEEEIKYTSSSKGNLISAEEMLEIFETKNQIFYPIAINSLQSLNIKNFINKLIPFLNSDIEQRIKILIYESLHESGYRKELVFNGKNLNIKNVGPVFDNILNKNIFIFFENNIEKNPTLKNAAKSNLINLIYKDFPERKFIKLQNIEKMILNISSYMLGIVSKINEEELSLYK
ncbi:MAG: hypothetical protein K4H23_04125, partial [Mollicutes bacterium PWAP]|nr:hypothetical protein [Mollicutes bacterium PWAP]